MSNLDTIVIGGGSAGVIAAVQAARAGARTLLVERAGQLGGTTTVAGVNFPGLFHAWGRQVIAGIGWELVERSVRMAGGSLPDFTRPGRHYEHQVRVDPFVFSTLCDQAVGGAGARLLLHTMPAQIQPADDGWRVTLCTKTGLETHYCRVLIDATGDANVVSLAGLPVNVIADSQPGTLMCRATGYDPKQLDMEAINRAFDAEVRAGRLKYSDASYAGDKPNIARWLHSRGQNSNHVILAVDARTSAGRTDMELEGRRLLLRMMLFLRTQPGLENLRFEYVAGECGIRETATIIGQATITLDDYTSGRRWPDAVCYSYYPIDLHQAEKDGLDYRLLAEGIVPTVPRGALRPKDSRNLLVAGRCLSSDRLANSALRVQATAMAVGQAAGALAALASRAPNDVDQVPLSSLHDLLRAHGAIVPPVDAPAHA